jgi:hypothetical protein
MRRPVSTIVLGAIAAVAVAAVAVSCGDDNTTAPAGHPTYVANLSTAGEKGNPAFTQTSSGVATFVDMGTSIDWTLNVTNVTGMTLSHIHLGDEHAVAVPPASTDPAATGAGPVIINLLIPNAATGLLNGEIARGSITNAANANVSLDSLRVLFNNGHAYANLHTQAHPGGEIRDQIHPAP